MIILKVSDSTKDFRKYYLLVFTIVILTILIQSISAIFFGKAKEYSIGNQHGGRSKNVKSIGIKKLSCVLR
jgi:hypothetical protein